MQARLTTKPEQDIIAAIQGLDLEPVKLRVMDPKLGEGWTREYADSIEIAYKNYLTMLVKYQDDAEDILPSKDVDEFWHTHILHTMKYTEDCERVFGKYLHHSPQVGEQSPAGIERRAALVEKTRRLYQREFGNGRDYDTTWPGISVKTQSAAMCSVAVRAVDAAMCSVAVRAEDAAMCSVAIRAEDAAMCSVAIRAGNAAMCSVAVRAEDAAMCSVAIPAENAAKIGAAVRVNNSPRAIAAAA